MIFDIVDEQVEAVRGLARQEPGLDLLTRLPDSMAPGTPCKAVDDIRSLAIAYVVNETVARTLEEERTGMDKSGQPVKQSLSIPRPLYSPFVGIPAMEYDPMDLANGAW